MVLCSMAWNVTEETTFSCPPILGETFAGLSSFVCDILVHACCCRRRGLVFRCHGCSAPRAKGPPQFAWNAAARGRHMSLWHCSSGASGSSGVLWRFRTSESGATGLAAKELPQSSRRVKLKPFAKSLPSASEAGSATSRICAMSWETH